MNTITDMDEKELNKAAEKYSNTYYNYAEFIVTHYEFGDPVEEIEDDKPFIKDAFIAGARWALENNK